MIKISVIIVNAGRDRHLRNVLEGILKGEHYPDEIIVVNVAERLMDLKFYPKIKQVLIDPSTMKDALGIGELRNIGAKAASFDLLCFLDVDCIPSSTYFSMIVESRPLKNCLYMGTPRYMTSVVQEVDFDWLDHHSILHPARPNFAQLTKYDDFCLFWSLCFYMYADDFNKLDGFDESFRGYGAEDTDFALRAQSKHMEFWLSPFIIYHQQHDLYRPPYHQFRSIINNCETFYDRWKFWPMENFLDSFHQDKFIVLRSDGSKIQILKEPSNRFIQSKKVCNEPFL